METQRIVITGGPGTGKTTLINALESEGYHIMPEISRDVILEAQKEGIEQLFLAKPLLFSEKLLEGRLSQYKEAPSNSMVLYDRGMPDVNAYMDYLGTPYPTHFDHTCREHRYDQVFILPPWKEIYVQDNERYESFDQAQRIYQYLIKGYEKYGYEPSEVPIDTVDIRLQFIKDRCPPR
ncbi:MAG: ATP-binding protein [Flavobacteriaceae bacterium]|nr:ATP-binding protein [Flavobacteriaceae bacterium]